MKSFFQCFTVAAFALIPICLQIRTVASVNQFRSQSQLQQDEIIAITDSKFELKDFDFWSKQCLSLSQAKQFTQALSACEQAIALKPKSKNNQLWSARSQSLFDLGKYGESLSSYERVVANMPKNSSAIAYQCAALFELNKYEDAVDKCSNALQVNGSWENASPSFAWMYKGLALRRLGRLKNALDGYKSAIKSDADNQFAVGEFFSTLAEVGNYLKREDQELKKVIAPYEEAIKTNPSSFVIADLCLNLAKTGNYGRIKALKLGDKLKNCGLENALAAYENATVAEPNHPTMMIQQGLALEQSGLYERAIISYNQAIKLNPENSFANLHRCSVLNTLDDYKSALESCDKALAAQGMNAYQFAYLWTQRSAASIGLGKYEEALATSDRAIAISPDYPPAYMVKAISLWYIKNDSKEAKGAIKTAIEKYIESENVFKNTFIRNYPDSPSLFYRGKLLAYYNQGRILASSMDYLQTIKAYEEALRVLKQYTIALQLNSQNPENLSSPDKRIIANIYANQSAAQLRSVSHSENIVEVATKATIINPNSFVGWYNKGLALVKKGRSREAIEAFNLADKLSPKNKYILTAKAMALQKIERYTEALAAYEQVLEIEPNNFYALSGKGIASQNLKSYPEALEAFDKVLKIEPENEYILKSKGNTLINLSRFDEAIATFNKVLALNSKDSFAWTGKGTALDNQGKKKEAIAAYEQAPDNENARKRLAILRGKQAAIKTPRK